MNLAGDTLARTRTMPMESTTITLIPISHAFPRRDLPALLRYTEGWLGVSGLAALFLFVSYYPKGLYWCFGVLLCLFAAVSLWRRSFTRQRPGARALCSVASHNLTPSSRLVCQGTPEELEPLRHLSDVSFEPFIVQVGPSCKCARLTTPIVRAFLWRDLLVLISLALFWMSVTPVYVVYAVLAVVAVGPGVIRTCWPVYYRVSPQRLDVQQYGFLSTKGTLRARIALDRARVECRYDQQEVLIAGVEGHHDALRIDLSSLSGPHAFVEALFRAAISSKRAPALPERELLS